MPCGAYSAVPWENLDGSESSAVVSLYVLLCSMITAENQHDPADVPTRFSVQDTCSPLDNYVGCISVNSPVSPTPVTGYLGHRLFVVVG